jgi:Flp pilus assembly pilin Flp
LWRSDQGQDIAEYAVMLAVILVIVIGTVRLIGGNANNVFSTVASTITQQAEAPFARSSSLAEPAPQLNGATRNAAHRSFRRTTVIAGSGRPLTVTAVGSCPGMSSQEISLANRSSN